MATSAELLTQAEELRAGRMESDIGMSESYWNIMNAYRLELAKEEAIPIAPPEDDGQMADESEESYSARKLKLAADRKKEADTKEQLEALKNLTSPKVGKK